MRQNAAGHVRQNRPGRAIRFLKVLGAFVLLILAAGLGLLWQFGPRFGVFLVPPSPAGYADAALRLMDNGYYATGEKWREARQQAVNATRHAPDYASTLPTLRQALIVAGGRHSKLLNTGETLAERVGPSQTPKISTVQGITTVTVPAIATNDAQTRQNYADTLASGLVKAAPDTTCGWIVDLRHNTGGDMSPMLAGLSPLLGDGIVGGFIDNRGQKTELILQGGEVRLGGSATLKTAYFEKLSGPVAVLQDGMTASSGEVVLLAFHGRNNTRTFGAASTGLSTANQVRRLFDGTEMLITVALDIDPQGQVQGGVIAPQEGVSPAHAPGAALTWLANQCR